MITLEELGLDAIGDVLLGLHVVGYGREPDLGMDVWNTVSQVEQEEEEKPQEELIMLIYYTVLEVPDTVPPGADGIQGFVSERGPSGPQVLPHSLRDRTGPRIEKYLD